jgi:hypothetical protein
VTLVIPLNKHIHNHQWPTLTKSVYYQRRRKKILDTTSYFTAPDQCRNSTVNSLTCEVLYWSFLKAGVETLSENVATQQRTRGSHKPKFRSFSGTNHERTTRSGYLIPRTPQIKVGTSRSRRSGARAQNRHSDSTNSALWSTETRLESKIRASATTMSVVGRGRRKVWQALTPGKRKGGRPIRRGPSRRRTRTPSRRPAGDGKGGRGAEVVATWPAEFPRNLIWRPRFACPSPTPFLSLRWLAFYGTPPQYYNITVLSLTATGTFRFAFLVFHDDARKLQECSGEYLSTRETWRMYRKFVDLWKNCVGTLRLRMFFVSNYSD